MLTPLLSQSGSAEQVGELLTALGCLVGAAVIAVVVGVVVYKRFSPSQQRDEGSTAFSLVDLRRLRDEGQITEDEFQKARGRVIGESQDTMDKRVEI